MNTVCVLMTSFNGENYIKDQIESILNQIGVKVKLYVSDDCSTDKTLRIVESYAETGSIVVLKNDIKHGAAGKNFFSMISRVDFDQFDFVAFADQDDVWDSDKLLKSVMHIGQTNRCVGVSSSVQAFWPDGSACYVDKAHKKRNFDYFFEAAGPGCTYLFKSSFANELKKVLELKPWIYSTVFSHDWFVYAYAREMQYGWDILPYSTLQYRQHDANETGVNNGFPAFKKRLSKLKSGWYLDQVYAVAKAVGYERKLNEFFDSRGKPNLIFYLKVREMRRKLSDSLLLGLFFLFAVVR